MKETPHSKRPCDHEGLNLSYDKKIHKDSKIQDNILKSLFMAFVLFLKQAESNKYWNLSRENAS